MTSKVRLTTWRKWTIVHLQPKQISKNIFSFLLNTTKKKRANFSTHKNEIIIEARTHIERWFKCQMFHCLWQTTEKWAKGHEPLKFFSSHSNIYSVRKLVKWRLMITGEDELPFSIHCDKSIEAIWALYGIVSFDHPFFVLMNVWGANIWKGLINFFRYEIFNLCFQKIRLSLWRSSWWVRDDTELIRAKNIC